jgi:ABC-type thiamine transport system ATPase subunit
METIMGEMAEHYRRQAEAYLRRNAPRLRREFWDRKAREGRADTLQRLGVGTPEQRGHGALAGDERQRVGLLDR